jgi:hypothetical protein
MFVPLGIAVISYLFNEKSPTFFAFRQIRDLNTCRDVTDGAALLNDEVNDKAGTNQANDKLHQYP